MRRILPRFPAAAASFKRPTLLRILWNTPGPRRKHRLPPLELLRRWLFASLLYSSSMTMYSSGRRKESCTR
jgi:hypothetical protein